MIYGVTSVRSHEIFGDSFYYVKRQLFFIFLGVISGIFVLCLDYHYLQRYSKLVILLALVSLVMVLIPGIGHRIGGARRWFKLGIFNFQPSEFAKLAIIIYLADLLSRKGIRINLFWRGFAPAIIVIIAMVFLILVEPDLGTAMVIAWLGVILLFVAGLRPAYFFSIIALAAPVFYFLIALKPYRLNRIITFLDPWADRLGSGHQIIQSMIALGSGGLWGIGLGHSLQKLYYLPAAHTDFIFSIIGEELGLMGTATVLVLFAIFFWIGLKITLKVKDAFGRFLSTGLLSLIALEVIIHIGVSTASLPTKGLPLPFISYGGTSLLVNIIATAIMLNISKNGL